MLSITLLTDRIASPIATELSAALAEAGFRVNILDFVKGHEHSDELEASSAFVGIVSETRHDDTLLISLAYLIGRQKNVWILSDDIDRVPQLLRRASYISLRDPDLSDALIKQIRKALSIETPSLEAMRDLNFLTTWLVERPSRISGLSSSDFQRLVFYLLEDVGLRYEEALLSRSSDLVFREPVSHNLLLVEMKNYVAGQKIGVGTIERSAANALSLGCNFTVIISANEFTPAATELAKLSAPPVWLLGRELLENLIREKAEVKSKFRKNAEKLFKWFLSKQADPAHQRSQHFPYVRLLPEHNAARTAARLYFSDWYDGSQMRPGDVKNEVFFSFSRSETDDTKRKHIVKLITGLQNDGYLVWHDLPSLKVGRECRHLSEVARAARRSEYVFLFIGPNPESSVKSLKIRQTVASELSKQPNDHLKVYVIGADNPWNRLKLPGIFHDATFLNPAETKWQSTVFSLCKEATKAEREDFPIPKS